MRAAARRAGPHFLLRALRTVIRTDSDPARQTLFATLMRSHPSVRLVYEVHERIGGTWASAILVSCYGIGCFLSIAPARHRRARVVSMARHANARRQVDRVMSWIGPAQCGSVRTGVKALLGPACVAGVAILVSRGGLVRMIRVIRALDTRHGFLVACRAAAAIAWYARSTRMLRAHRPGAVLVSSDSNPEEAGFIAAARALDIPQVFVAHAYPTPLTPPLDFTLSILEGEAAVDARRRKGPIKGDVLLAGVEGESAPLDPRRLLKANPVIGIFTSKAISWPTLVRIIDDCLGHLRARQVLIRWHPSLLERPRLARVLDDMTHVVETPRTAALADVARQCDWVIADVNSNVHLPVLKLGIPTVAVKSLGVYPESRADQYGFVANRIVFPPVQSVRDLDVPAVIEFFAEWPTRFERYDASYLRPGSAVGDDVRRAVEGLLAARTPLAT